MKYRYDYTAISTCQDDKAPTPKTRRRRPHAAEVYAKRQQLGEEAINHAHSIKVYALQKLGEMLKATERNQGAKGIGKSAVPKENHTPTLLELGIDKKISALAQKVAALPQAKVDELAAKVETISRAHVGQNSGDNEWYTPVKYVEAARRVLGGS